MSSERMAGIASESPLASAATKGGEEELPFAANLAQLERPLSLPERLWNQAALRKLLVVALIVVLWQWYALRVANPLIFPPFSATAVAVWEALVQGELPLRIAVSLKVLSHGYLGGVILATLLAAFATSSRLGNDALAVLTAMFNPLPAIALLPLSLLWFGLGNGSITFVLIHAVLWPVALSTHSGFSSVNPTIRMVGRNYGLTGWRYVVRILIPAAFPSILTGLKNGWAFAWRTLIAAELVFGVSSGSGGVGWFIYENKNQLEIARVFAGLLAVITIGVAMDLFFRQIERRTVLRWGMIT